MRYSLNILGTFELRDAHGAAVNSILQQPRRSALLVYLALADRDAMVKRDTLLGIFWPELTQEEREQRILVNFTHYGAPAVIYLLVGRDFFYQSKGINVWSIYDCGLACENLMLAAVNEGLATVVQAQAVTYPDIVRKATGIPESKLIAMGIAIGYPDWKAPRNERRSTRDSMDSVVTWYGFH